MLGPCFRLTEEGKSWVKLLPTGKHNLISKYIIQSKLKNLTSTPNWDYVWIINRPSLLNQRLF